MFRLFLITILASACGAYLNAQSEMPSDITLKLDEKAKKLFPDDARKQDRWLRDQNDGWVRLSYFEAPKGNEALFEQAKKVADKKFELDFFGKAEFLQKSLDALTIIDGYATYFPQKQQFESLKAAALKANPEDFMAAAKFFEQQSQAVMEISAIPMPESVDEDLWTAVKLAAANKYPNDYPKQKEYVEKCASRFNDLYTFEESRRAEAKIEQVQDVSLFEKLTALKSKMEKSVLLLKSPNPGLAFRTTIHEKDVIIFPFSSYDSREMAITNLADDRVVFGDVFVCKEVPIAIAMVKSCPDGIEPIELAPDTMLKSLISKEEYIFAMEQRSTNMQRVKIMSLSNMYVNLANRISNSIPQGANLLNVETSSTLGFVVKTIDYGAIPDFSNKENARYVIKNISKDRYVNKVLRLDMMKTWEKVDPVEYTKQLEELDKLIKTNLDFINFFTAKNLADLESMEVFQDICSKYTEMFQQRVDENTRNKQLKDMVYDVMTKMRNDLRNYTNAANVYGSLKQEFNYNLEVRKKMIETLEKAVRSNAYRNYDFDDLKIRR